MNDEHNDEILTPRAPSRRRRVIANLGWLLGGAVLAVLLVADPLDLHPLDLWLHDLLAHRHRDVAARAAAENEPTQQLWTCGMHPQVIQDQPGQCPICGMNLVPLDSDAGAAMADAGEMAPASHGEREVLFYRNPMDPTITSPVPSKDSMGMDYVPVYADEAEAAGRGGATVRIDPGVVQNMNVVTATVERGDLSREIRTVGYLDYDQEQMVSVTTKFSGFVEKVYVNYVGEPVRKGQPLFEIYSPELSQTQDELLSALAFARRLEQAPEEARRRTEGAGRGGAPPAGSLGHQRRADRATRGERPTAAHADGDGSGRRRRDDAHGRSRGNGRQAGDGALPSRRPFESLALGRGVRGPALLVAPR